MRKLELGLADEQATADLGADLAAALQTAGLKTLTVLLEGDLGAGKTTLARGFLRGLGYKGRVPSPTYTLVEPYELAGLSINHIDLYRLSGASELEFLGLREILDGITLVEWPSRSPELTAKADLKVGLRRDGAGRLAEIVAKSTIGESLVPELAGLFRARSYSS